MSKKMTLIFMISTLIGIIIFVCSGLYMVDFLYVGETTRISGITTGAISRFQGEMSKLQGETRGYARSYENGKKLEENYGIGGLEEIGIYKRVEKDGIDYKICLESDFKVRQILYGNKEEEQWILETLETLKTHMKDPSTMFEGMIGHNEKPYYAVVEPLWEYPNRRIAGYFVTLTAIDAAFIKEIAQSMAKQIKLVSKYNHDFVEPVSTRLGEIDLVYDEDQIRSYYKIPLLSGDDSYFLEVTEPLVVKNSTRNNILVIVSIVIIMFIILNAFLWFTIDRTIVQRLKRLSNDVNQIKETSDLGARIHEDHGKDELSTLSTEINSMVTSLETTHHQLLENEQKYRHLVNIMSNGFAQYEIIESDPFEAICTEVNDAMLKIYNCSKEDILYQSISKLKNHGPFKIVHKIENILKVIYETDEPVTFKEIEINTGTWVEFTVYLVGENQFATIATDISTLKEYSNRMKDMANFDSLTGLFNRHKLTTLLQDLEEPFTLFFMDIDNFKDINDALGHHTGDEVLCQVAKKLKQFASEDTIVGRLGGDEFLVIQKGRSTLANRQYQANEIVNCLGDIYQHEYYQFNVSVSMGISFYPEQSTDYKHLLRYADIAMYKCKQTGGNKYSIFSLDMLEEIEIEGLVKEALTHEEFSAYYQPIYDLKNQKILGAEALARWLKNDQIILPYKFISVAKKTGDIVRIDQLVLENACKFCKKQREEYCENFTISVNASYRWLMQKNVAGYVQKALEEANLPAQALRLEITEDEVLDNPREMIKILESIKKLGVKIALDDFGIGYSSFNHIKMLPIDVLKIDRSLLLQVEEDYKTKSIIEAMVKLSHKLGLEVVCEGVETKKQIELLEGIGCDKIQGYYISRPVPNMQFDKLMESQHVS